MSAQSRRGHGHPPLTDQLTHSVSQLVVLGVPAKAAAATMGVAGEVFDKWIADGARNSRGKYRQRLFVLAVDKATAQLETQLIGKIRGAANENWQAAAWLAERRFPEKYVRKSVSADSEAGKQSGANVPQLDPFRDLDDNVTPIRRK